MVARVGARVGEYVLEEELGRGLLGRAFKAQQGKKKKRVVLKALDVDDYGWLLRTRYGETRVNLDRVAAVRGFERVLFEDDGQAWVVAGPMSERTLAHLLAQGPLRPGPARELVLGVARVLSEAHGRGRVHGWLKPSNVLVDGTNVVLADFGLRPVAARLGGARLVNYMGDDGAAALEFLPPEERAGDVEPTTVTDTYALGALIARVFGEGVAAPLARVVERATHPTPGERFADAREMLAVLEKVLASALTQSGSLPALGGGEAAPAAAAATTAATATGAVPEVTEFNPLADEPTLDLEGDVLAPAGAAPAAPAARVPAPAPPPAPPTPPARSGPKVDDLLAELDVSFEDPDAAEEAGSLTGLLQVPKVADLDDDLLGDDFSKIAARQTLRRKRLDESGPVPLGPGAPAGKAPPPPPP
ncbi:MAG: hypothetical protein KF878_27635, partial [Planctomycetes bacterium]|nr:hypothetical protein [Planctomycetota bacterium]